MTIRSAVIFDWGGTLTRWHDIDFHAESFALAQAVRRTPSTDDDHHAHAARLHSAGDVVWGRSRDHQQSATIARPLRRGRPRPRPRPAAGLLRVLGAAHARPTPRWGRCGRSCAGMGVKVGVLSNTLWPREWHVGFFERDGVLRPRRRRRLLQRDPVDQAVAARVRRGDGGGGGHRPGCLRLRRRPALRRRLGRPQRRAPCDPRAAQHHPGRPGGAHRGRARRERSTRCAEIPAVVRGWSHG